MTCICSALIESLPFDLHLFRIKFGFVSHSFFVVIFLATVTRFEGPKQVQCVLDENAFFNLSLLGNPKTNSRGVDQSVQNIVKH